MHISETRHLLRIYSVPNLELPIHLSPLTDRHMRTSQIIGNLTSGDDTHPSLHQTHPTPFSSQFWNEMAPKRAAAFTVGAKVEVCNNTAGFRGSWYEATIVRAIRRRRSYDVEYVSRVADDDPSQPLRKTVLGSLVRPRRPRKVSSARYAVREHVEAYHDGGWRRGVVSASHGGDPPERYTVRFTGSKEEMEFSPAEIRPHLEWRHGHWCLPQHRGQPSLTGKNLDLPSSPFPSSPDDLEQANPFPSSSDDLEQANPMSLKRKMTGQKEEFVPKKVLKKGESLNLVGMEIDPKTPATNKEVLAATKDVESPPTELATLLKNPLFDELGVEQRSVKGKSPIGLVVPGERPSNTAEQVSKTQNVKHLSSTSFSGKLVLPNQWRIIKGVRSPREIVGMQINTPAIGEQIPQELADLTSVKQHPSAEAKKRRGRPPKKSLASINRAKLKPSRKPGDRVIASFGTSSRANIYKQGLVNNVLDNISSPSRQVEVMMPASSPVAVEGVEVRSSTKASERVVDMVILNKKGVFNVTAGNVPSPSRRVEVIVSASSPVAVKGAKLQPSTTSGEVVENNGTRTRVNLNKHSMLNDASDNVPSSSRQVEENLAASSPVAVKDIFDALGNVPSSSRQIEVTLSASLPVAFEGTKLQQPTTTSDRVVASGNFPSPCRQDEVMMSANSLVAVRDVSDSPAMNYQEIGLPTTHDVAPRSDTASEGEDRAVPPPPPSIVDPTPIVSLSKKLPFRKTSILWGEVESLEVFRAIPQDPHFCLVEKQSGKDFCEGMAIGLMVTFDNLVKDIRKLDVTDSNQAFEERLGSLKMLEENGFYVESLRTRIAELLQEKLKLIEIDNKMTTLKEKVSGISSEKDRIGVTSFVVDKTIDEVEMHLTRLNDKKKDLASQEILKEAELAELKKKVGASVKAYHSGVQRFRRIAAAPW